MHHYLDIHVSSGNNGNGRSCKDNPSCINLPDQGPIPTGEWIWTKELTGKPNGRVLEPRLGTRTYNRSLFRTHSCFNPFGPSKTVPFCSGGCITGNASDIKRLNELLDSEP